MESISNKNDSTYKHGVYVGQVSQLSLPRGCHLSSEIFGLLSQAHIFFFKGELYCIHLLPKDSYIFEIIFHFLSFFKRIIAWMRPVPVESFYGWELIRRNYSCITKASWLVLRDTLVFPFGFHLDCEDCHRASFVAPLQLVNAILLVSEPPCTCGDQIPPFFFLPQEGML